MEGFESYILVFKYLLTTSLILFEAMNLSIGRPISLAIIPAHILPKFPLGTENAILSPCSNFKSL